MAEATERLYLVKNGDGSERLVWGVSQAGVLMHCARKAWTVSVAGSKDVARAMGAGVVPETVETAGQ